MSAGSVGKDILVGTADAEDARQLKELCESSGYRVFTALTGDEVFQKTHESKPDVLLLDLAIQKRDGFTVLKELREDASMNDLPVVVLANVDDLDAKIRGMELGADDYMTRPYKVVELQTRVGSALMVREYRKRLMAVEAELAQLRALDPVSGAGTASQLKASLDSELARARRYGRPASVLMMGLDGYEQLREQLGEAKCDEYVGRLAKAIRHTLRGADRLFRVEANEFVIMLPETDLKGARLAADRLNKIAVGIVATGRRGEKLETVIRFGGAVFPHESIHNADELVEEATRVYRTLAGQNRTIFDFEG